MGRKIHNSCKFDKIDLLLKFIKIHKIDLDAEVEKVYTKGKHSRHYFNFIAKKHNVHVTGPYIIYDSCDTKIPENWYTDKEYTIVPVYIVSSEGNHQNVILINWNKKIIERFEPLAYSTFDEYCDVTEILKRMFKDFTILTSENMLPIQKYQEMEKRDIKDGLCIGWSCFFVDIRLTFNDLDTETIINKVFDELNNGCGLSSFIIKYLNYLYVNCFT